MKIEAENGVPLSPLGSSAASNSSADEMLDTENLGLRDRVSDLEKKVLEQNDELTCLRATLADALRRLDALENMRGMNNYLSGGRATPTKDRLRLRETLSNSTPARDASRRSTSYIPAKSQAFTSAANSNRRPNHHQSTSSLYSDGHSSSSASPVPSPSPTHAQAPPTHCRPATSSPHPQSSSGPLNKRWASATDFNHPAGSSPGQSPSHVASPLVRRQNGGSLMNLSHLRSSNSQLSVSRPGRDAQYSIDEGIVKLYLRGRPLHLFVPSSLRETYHPQTLSSAPSAKLKLEWVYGYRGRDCRNNVYQLPTGEMVYFVAAVAVLYNVEEQMQRHYLGHTNDIKCLAVHPNKLIIATGQTAGHDRRDSRSWKMAPSTCLLNAAEAEEWPHIRVWDSVSLHTLHILGITDIEKSVACLAFSKADGGNLLVAIDEAPDHNMSVWDWAKGERGYKLMETKCSAEQVLVVDFSPLDRNAIITCGRSHISFWSYVNGMLSKRMGIFEKRERPKYVTAIAFSDTGNVVSGDSSGNLMIWQKGGNTVIKSAIGAHESAVFTILVQRDGSLITGGKDGRIVEWDRDLLPTRNYMEIDERFGAPRVITSGKGSRLIIGTTKNIILGGTFTLPIQPVMLGHTEEIWALAVHPSQQQFFTSGYDKICNLWDTRSRSLVWSKDIGEYVQSATFSPSGDIVVIGTTSGIWLAMDAETREMYSRHQDGSEPIQVLKFSPNGQYLAVASQDNSIYMYQVSEDCRKYTRLGRCQGHSSFVVHIDWSADSQYLQSNSRDYELLLWNAALCRQVIQPSQLRDVEWASHSCTLSFSTLGIWPEGADGTDINACNSANKHRILATGDDFGRIKLFTSPACYQKARYLEYIGHSSHVTGVDFLHDDTRLISVGGRDTSVMQWIFSPGTGAASRQN